MKKTTVMVVDDHPLVCVGLKAMISVQPDLSVVAEATSGKDALEQLRRVSIDVLLLDLQLSDSSGLDVLRDVQAHYPLTKVLVHSAYAETQFGLNVLRGGARGFISKGAKPEEFMRALRTVAGGGRYVGPALSEQLVEGIKGNATAPLHGALSAREFQVFCKIAAGETASQIAAQLFLSVKTVSTYRRRILDKMTMKSSADITSYAIRNDLI
jgi:two-component system, NarL family, invasion response regulator UvrY